MIYNEFGMNIFINKCNSLNIMTYPKYVFKQKRNSNISYGLMILIELAETNENQGYTLQYIAFKYDLPLEDLREVAAKLESEGLILRHKDNPNQLYLKNRPNKFWIHEMIAILKMIFEA